MQKLFLYMYIYIILNVQGKNVVVKETKSLLLLSLNSKFYVFIYLAFLCCLFAYFPTTMTLETNCKSASFVLLRLLSGIVLLCFSDIFDVISIFDWIILKKQLRLHCKLKKQIYIQQTLHKIYHGLRLFRFVLKLSLTLRLSVNYCKGPLLVCSYATVHNFQFIIIVFRFINRLHKLPPFWKI